MLRSRIGILILVCFAAPAVYGGGFGIVGRPDGHAPISVMGDHLHQRGEWMLSYRYMHMDMDGNLDGTQHESDREVLTRYPVSPTEMTMEMHMVGLMYGLTDDITLTAMLPFVRKGMDHRTRMGTSFSTKSSGIGDLKVSGLAGLFRGECAGLKHELHLNAGISVPTGGIHKRDETPMGDVRLPYPMQIGSGTVDLLPGLTWTGTIGEHWSTGGQVGGVIRLGRNSKDYSKGDVAQVQVWGARRWSAWLSSSLRASYQRMGNYGGSDEALKPDLAPTADPRKRAFPRFDLGVGLNFIIPRGPCQGNRFAVEVIRPVWQDLSGPQLEVDWQVVAGWQLAFGSH